MQLCNNQNIKNGCVSANQLNERCIELQKSNVPKSKKCSFLNGGKFTPSLDFVKKSRSDVLDIEELVHLGNEIHTCSYYGARQSLSGADIIFIPYNLLLVKGSRESLSLDLSNSIVIIDEAHNLIDSICSVHGSSLTWDTNCFALELVKKYFDKYWSRLSGQNVIFIRQLIKLLKSINKFFESKSKELKKHGTISQNSTKDNSNFNNNNAFSSTSPNKFLNSLNIDNINIYKLVNFLRQSQLSHKLNMFVDKINKDFQKAILANKSASNKKLKQTEQIINQNQTCLNDLNGFLDNKQEVGGTYRVISATAALASVESFIFSLASPESENSRIFISMSDKSHQLLSDTNKLLKKPHEMFSGELKYVLLDPSDPFSDILTLPRSVILAGGTMNPISDTVHQLGLEPESTNTSEVDLQPGKSKDSATVSVTDKSGDSNGAKKPKSLHVFECSHVINKENISCMVLRTGPNNIEFNLNFSGQKNTSMVTEFRSFYLFINIATFYFNFNFIFFCYRRLGKQDYLYL
ncbi:ATP-dependent RNA helicase chl1 [Smittium mucronatum]|uniref:ATP-dependent DNA helicase CHL1 n=1 Tax=Smittium mucronatum TaxID=133383 RepID=A0A1R0H3K4_9FUNG|nr:ATP-dependent RNA helicase chl1 [Smittium mucronatum]